MSDVAKVSVIIPIYNVEEFLPDCLQSVIKQTYQNLEIICINDGSPDKCADILAEFAGQDSRIKVINQVNGGQASARNHGLREAGGDYVFFLDSDDWLGENCLESLVRTMEKTKADMVCIHDIMTYYSPQKVIKDRMLSGHFEGVFEVTNEIIKQMWAVAWGKLYRRKQLADLQLAFPEGYIYEDEFFHHAFLVNARRVAVSDGGQLFYRQRENSTMSNKRLRSGKDNLVIFQKIYEYYHDHHLLQRYELPVRILGSGFVNNENPQAYYKQVKELLRKLGITYEMMGKNELMKSLYMSKNFQDHCHCEKRYRLKNAIKNFRKQLFRFKVGRKTHISLLGLTLLHKAKGEDTVLFGFKI